MMSSLAKTTRLLSSWPRFPAGAHMLWLGRANPSTSADSESSNPTEPKPSQDLRAYMKKYRERNADKIARQIKAWRQQNPTYWKQYYEKNAGEIKEYREKAREQRDPAHMKEYREKNVHVSHTKYLENRVKIIQAQAERREESRYHEREKHDKLKAAGLLAYATSHEYRQRVGLRNWLDKSWVQDLTWPTHQPVMYPDKAVHYCTGCCRNRLRKLWWRQKAHPEQHDCNVCFTSDWSRALPIGYQDKVFAKHRDKPDSAP